MLTEKKEAESRQEEMISRAYELAKAAHQGKNDRGGHPYIGHRRLRMRPGTPLSLI